MVGAGFRRPTLNHPPEGHVERTNAEDREQQVRAGRRTIDGLEEHLLAGRYAELNGAPDERVVDTQRMSPRLHFMVHGITPQQLRDPDAVDRDDELPGLPVVLRRASDRDGGGKEVIERLTRVVGNQILEGLDAHVPRLTARARAAN